MNSGAHRQGGGLLQALQLRKLLRLAEVAEEEVRNVLARRRRRRLIPEDHCDLQTCMATSGAHIYTYTCSE